MKIRSLLLGSAAALVAATGAQAADMPMAEPVEYVRICDAFGTGYYYIPGTDTCLKISGYVRVEMYAGDRPYSGGRGPEDQGDEEDGSISWLDIFHPNHDTLGIAVDSIAFSNNSKDNFSTFARGALSIDARRMTDIGLLRIAFQYLVNVDSDFDASESNSDSANLDFAFIQLSNDLGTMTVGHTGSFFNYKGSGTMEGLGANDANATLIGYSFNVGNGLSFSLAVEDSNSAGRNGGIEVGSHLASDSGDGTTHCDNQDGFLSIANSFAADSSIDVCFADHDGDQIPDLTGNLRLDQAWGSLQLMGALHQVRGNAVAAEISTESTPGIGPLSTIFAITEVANHHDDDWGWAVGAGGEVVAGGFSAFVQGFYGSGVGNYFWSPTSGAPVPEAVFDTSGSLDLSDVWLVNGAITASLGSSLTAVLAAAYGEYDGTSAGGLETPDHDEFTIGGDLIWTATSGFTIGVGAVHWDNSVFGEGTKGRVRFNASF